MFIPEEFPKNPHCLLETRLRPRQIPEIPEHGAEIVNVTHAV